MKKWDEVIRLLSNGWLPKKNIMKEIYMLFERYDAGFLVEYPVSIRDKVYELLCITDDEGHFLTYKIKETEVVEIPFSKLKSQFGNFYFSSAEGAVQSLKSKLFEDNNFDNGKEFRKNIKKWDKALRLLSRGEIPDYETLMEIVTFLEKDDDGLLVEYPVPIEGEVYELLGKTDDEGHILEWRIRETAVVDIPISELNTQFGKIFFPSAIGALQCLKYNSLEETEHEAAINLLEF